MKKQWLYLVLMAFVLVSCPGSSTTTPPTGGTTDSAKFDTATFDTAKFEP
jgi:hypothetical protein